MLFYIMPNNQFQTVLNALTVIIKQLIDDIPTMYHLPIPNLPSPLPPWLPPRWGAGAMLRYNRDRS